MSSLLQPLTSSPANCAALSILSTALGKVGYLLLRHLLMAKDVEETAHLVHQLGRKMLHFDGLLLGRKMPHKLRIPQPIPGNGLGEAFGNLRALFQQEFHVFLSNL